MDPQTTPDFIRLQEALAGKYSLERELGRGGMGVVFLAHEVALDRFVALKLLPPAMARESALRERFLREARTAAKLSHPNIVPIHAVDEAGEFVFFAMSYVEGDTLGQRIRQRGPLTRGDAVRLLREVAWALAYAHLHGIVHRDVKPDNILIEREGGRALVTDFGIAHLHDGAPMTGVGEIIGTAEFMSPEQAGGEPVDARSDIYSLGAVGFYTLTGTLPFDGDSLQAILAKHLTQPAPPLRCVAPEVPLSLAQAIDRCLLKDPDTRYANGDELASALGSAETRHDMPVPLRLFAHQSRERLRGGVAAVAIGGMIATAGVFNWLGGPGGLDIAPLLTGLGMGAAPGLFALSIARRAARAGYTHEDAIGALADEHARTREEGAFEVGRQAGFFEKVARGLAIASLATLAGGTAANMLGAQAGSWMVGLGLPAVLTFGVIAGHRHDRRHDTAGKRRLKLWKSFLGRGVLHLARLTTRRRLPGAAPTYQRTELAIGMAADRLFAELPRALRKTVRDLPTIVARLEADARAMRARVHQLDQLLDDIGGAKANHGAATSLPTLTTQRDALAADLTEARNMAQTRLQDAVTALETVRLDLLRMHAGAASAASVTANLSRARELSDDIARLLEGQEEVERALRREDE